MRNRRILAALLTCLIMGSLAWMARGRPSGSGQGGWGGLTETVNENESDEDVGLTAEGRVRSLLRAAAEGDVETYLAGFDDTYRQRLQQQMTERGREAFAAELQDAAKARTSHAIFSAEGLGESTTTTVVLESAYPDRNERQTFHLERSGGTWTVTNVETARAHKPQVPFGDQAQFQEPEGPPVSIASPALPNQAEP